MATKMNRKKKIRKHIGSFAIVGVVLLMLIFVSVASLKLRASNANKQEKIQELNAEIEAEKEKAEELKEYEKYVQTDKFKAEEAKRKLGLVFPDEILFKQEDQQIRKDLAGCHEGDSLFLSKTLRNCRAFFDKK